MRKSGKNCIQVFSCYLEASTDPRIIE